MKMEVNKMANFMKMRRVEIGISQSKLSLKSGIEQYRVSLIERNLVAPKPEEAKIISRLLGIQENELQKAVKPMEPCDG